MSRSLWARKEITRASERQRPAFETVGEEGTWRLMNHRRLQQRIKGESDALPAVSRGDDEEPVAAAAPGRLIWLV